MEAEPKTYATELFVEAEPKNDVTKPMLSEHLQETVDDATAAKDTALIEVEETCGSD
jgi:ubiquitin-like-specific protease 1C/D